MIDDKVVFFGTIICCFGCWPAIIVAIVAAFFTTGKDRRKFDDL